MISQPEIRRIVYAVMEYDKPYSVESIYEMVMDSYDFGNGDAGNLRKFQDRIRGFLAQEKKAGRMQNYTHGVWTRLKKPTPKRQPDFRDLDRRISFLENKFESMKKALAP